MPDTQALAVLIPLFHLIILNICSAARDIDLTEISGKASWGSHGYSFTELGRFGYIHVFNTSALSFAVFAIWNLGGFNNISFYLAILTFILLLLLPILETGAYDHIAVDEELAVPTSFNHHFRYSMYAVLLLSLPALVQGLYNDILGEMSTLYWGILVMITAFVWGRFLTPMNRKFLQALQKEIQEQEDSSGEMASLSL